MQIKSETGNQAVDVVVCVCACGNVFEIFQPQITLKLMHSRRTLQANGEFYRFDRYKMLKTSIKRQFSRMFLSLDVNQNPGHVHCWMRLHSMDMMKYIHLSRYGLWWGNVPPGDSAWTVFLNKADRHKRFDSLLEEFNRRAMQRHSSTLKNTSLHFWHFIYQASYTRARPWFLCLTAG